MNENVRKVFDMLGVEPYETFKASDVKNSRKIIEYFIDNDLKVNTTINGESSVSLYLSISQLLTGERKIFKQPKFTELEQKIIDLYKELGYKWIAKDSSGCVYAYDYKPIKKVSLGYWEAVANSSAITQLPICLNFDSLSFEDTEPYYIGD